MNLSSNHKSFIKSVFNRYFILDENSVDLLYSIVSINQLNKGTSLLGFGEISKDIHIIYKGVMVSCFLNSDGDLYHKNIFLEGHFAGSLVSTLTGKPSEFALEAIEPCTLLSFNFKKFKALLASNSDLKNFYIAYLEKNWVIDKEQIEIDIVTKDAKTRYINFLAKHKNADNIPLRYIASHLGVTPTQLSRIRKTIKENK
ncbi:Crp/Fnr family transcriptional regulator [Seonamhaeicola marinus]|uniref:Crp/Fnr family transcriptional regulator n=1 Tax=Seonamhaeicola marinus TaxID=1912246 RepID=A0A5D0I6R5_9FLAO|nr:Crp/Fnr family transcriptional regulator [Seonamhaeicola marinus]TYA78581.1 Crp/Fnr family transcriptional regulator [Seonamhaeicola marinus]